MGALLGVCVTLVSAACADGPTGLDPMSIEAGRVQSAARADSGGTVDVVCSTSVATPGGPYAYGYGRLTVKLPAATRAADGSTRQYRYRGYAEGQRVVLAANCTIPNTEQAFRQMNQRFGVKEAHAGKGWNDGGGATTLSDYTLPPLVVNACRYGGDYPECNPPPTYGETDLPTCYDGMEGCDDGGGGSSPEPPAEEGDPVPCNTSDPVINHDNVEAGFNRIWLASNPDAQDQMHRLEKGGFIVQTATGIDVQDFPAEWTSGPCSIAIPLNAQAPPGTIGVIHTHPWTVGEQQTSCGPIVAGTQLYQNYPGTFTDADQNVLTFFGQQLGRTLTGYILDKDGIRKFYATSVQPESFGRCAF